MSTQTADRHSTARPATMKARHCCANNPMKYVDPTGCEFDPTQYDKYVKPMIADIEKKISQRTAMRDKYENGSAEYERLNGHVTELGNALKEIQTLKDDKNNIYNLTFAGIDFNKDAGGTSADAAGTLTYGGQKDGKNVININMRERYAGTTGTMLHEFKHAYQFCKGEVGFFVYNLMCTDGHDAMISYGQEKSANYRGAVYSSDKTPSPIYYNLQGYRDYPSGNTSRAEAEGYARKIGMIYVTGNSK